MSFSDTGLSSDEVRRRIEAGQVNRTDRFTTRTISAIIRNNILTLFAAILTAAVGALLLIGAYDDAVVLGAVTAANILAGIIGELRAKRALDRLAILIRRKIAVIRNGSEETVWLDEVVKDDLVVLRSGDPVIADGVIAESSGLFLDESLLTGEADLIAKHNGDPVLSGSYCVWGEGRYFAAGVGAASNAGALTAQAKTYKIFRSPLERAIGQIIRVLIAIMILLSFLIVMANYIQELPVVASILEIATMIKALVPEGLVLVTTTAFALGAFRSARRHVLVQKLNAVESISHLTVLCLDKTGTLGTNRLIFDGLEVLDATHGDVADQLQAFVGAVREKNETLRTIEAVFPGIPSNPIDELPFSSKTKLSAVQILYRDAEVSLWLGAPESLMQGRAAKAQEDKLAELRRSGLRVLAFASGPASLKQRGDLNILAFIILRDELRPDVREAVSFFGTRGIKLKVLSGDHPETVAAIAMQAGLKIADPVYIGADLDLLTPDEFKTAVMRGQIFGRLVPQQKQKIVKYLQETGEFVGMVGDGINDILALKQADIGIAMKSGAAAALDVADIILLKNTFAHLPTLAREGDRIIYNIKRVAKLFLTKNVYSLFFVLFSGFVGLPFPLSPKFITWIDLLTVGTPAFLLTLMSAHVPKQTVNDFLRETLGFSLIAGLIIALVSLIVYTDFFLWQNPMANYDKTAALSIVILMGLYIVYYVTPVERKSDSSLMQKAVVWAILAVGLILNVLAVYWGRLSGFIGLVALDAVSWFIIIAAAVVGSIAFHILLKSFRGI